jgi:hypothetical protein
VGKRKNRHCQNRQEVLQKIRKRKTAERQEKRKPPLERQLETINRIRNAVERKKEKILEREEEQKERET